MPSPTLRPEGPFLRPFGWRSLVYSRFHQKCLNAYGSQEMAWMRAHNDAEISDFQLHNQQFNLRICA